MRKFAFLSMAFVALLAAPAASNPVEPAHYTMIMAMYDGNRLIAKPTLEVAAGERADVVFEPGDGSSYKASVVVNPMTERRLHMQAKFIIKSVVAGTISAEPTLIVKEQEQATLEFGNDDGGHQPFRAELTFSSVSH